MSEANSPEVVTVVSSPGLGTATLAGVVDLLFRPRRFYAAPPPWLRHPAVLPAMALIAGASTAMGRVERTVMQADMRGGDPTVATITSSWAIVWALVIGGGVLSGALLWTLGIWWYRLRLRWSGAPDVDPDAAREVYLPAVLIRTAPGVLALIWATVRYESYRAYWDAPGGIADLLVLVFPFWSVWVGYCGVREQFPVARGRARFWFLIAPAAVFVVALGVLGTIAALASPPGAPWGAIAQEK